MIQKNIRQFGGVAYTNAEADELTQELNDRTKSDIEGYNSIDEQAVKMQYGYSYILVRGIGTPEENGLELEEAYVTAKGMSPTVDNVITVVVFPGEYGLSEKLVLDTPYINLVSLTGNRDVILDRADVVGDPFDFDVNWDITESGDVLLIDADYIYVKGMVGKLRNSSKYNDYFSTFDYILPIQVATNLPNIIVENCVGGFVSFGGDYTWGSNPIDVSGTFNNCTSGFASFGGEGIASGTFNNCTGGEESFGGYGTASGTFTNCTGGGDSSFGGYGTASGTFTNCIGGDYSFGGNGTASGTFNNCIGGQISFGGSNSSNSGFASGTFNNCTSGYASFGGGYNGTLSGQLYYCRLTLGTFETVTSPGRTYYCVDGTGVVNNQ